MIRKIPTTNVSFSEQTKPRLLQREEGHSPTSFVQTLSTGTSTTAQLVAAVIEEDEASNHRRSTFYVALNSSDQPATDDSLDLSACSLDWSLNESSDATPEDPAEGESAPLPHDRQLGTSSSTPIKSFGKSRSRSNILHLPERITLSPAAISPLREKSKTLPQSLGSPVPAVLPAKRSLLLKSSPRISSQMAGSPNFSTASPSPPPQVIPLTAKSPRKSLSFIRRSHSTKVLRSSSLLRSFTSKQQPGQSQEEDAEESAPRMVGLNAELLERLFKITVPGDFDESLRRIFFRGPPPSEEGTSFTVGPSFEGSEREEEDAIHSGNNAALA